MNSSELEIIPLAAPLGAEVKCGDVRKLTDATREALHLAYLDHIVLVFRDQQLSDSDLIEFTHIFGEPRFASPELPDGIKARDQQHPEISVISNVVENGVGIGTLGYGEARWHSDNSYREVPLAASLLYALEIPASGGETGFANMYRALERLDPSIRRRIEGRTIKHDQTYNSAGQIRKGFSPPADVRSCPGVDHPIIRTHPETGVDALYLGRRPNAYINGLPVDESEALLDTLWEHATQPEFAWHHTWKVHDVLVWDNRCAMHHRNPFDPGARRIMHRTQTKGTRPFYNDTSATKRPHPRALLQTRIAVGA